jgi:predicted amino acid racemase
MSTKTVKTTTITDVINVTREMGDKVMTHYNKTGDLKVGHLALDAYKTAISATKAQLIYKKLTGTPEEIDFLK